MELRDHRSGWVTPRSAMMAERVGVAESTYLRAEKGDHKVAFGVYADDASLKDGWENQIIFPLNVNVLNDPAFVDAQVKFFDGQQANKEVYVPAANAYKGMTYTPIGQYFYTAFTKQIAAINDGSATGDEAADALQKDVSDYAKEQGFTVK